MATHHQPHADEFDPYLQRDDASSESHDGHEGTCYPPSPVSPWPAPVRPDSLGPYQIVSTAQPQDGATPATSRPAPEKTEPLSSTSPCSQTSSTTTKPADRLPSAGGWWLECLSALFSIIFVVAMVIVLVEFDGKLLSSWVWAVSPNAVVSILSTASKAAMIMTVAECISQLKWIYLGRHGQQGRYVLYQSTPNLEHLQVYDNASRGPLGSLKFLWKARGVSWGISILSYVGCFVTIAALALDPFTQQILAYTNDVHVVTGSRSSVPRSQLYDYGEIGAAGSSTYINSARDTSVIAGGIAALYGSQPTSPFTCPGSNCTFPDFQTLGVHPTVCTDVTAQTSKDCNNNCTYSTSDPVTNCTYTTPLGFQLHARSYWGTHTGFGYTYINSSIGEAKTTTAPSIFTMGVITFDNAAALAQNYSGLCDTSWQDTMKAYDCAFDLCAMSYENYTYVDGKIQPGQRRISRLSRNGMVGELFTYETVDKSFPGNQSYYLNYMDRTSIADGFSDLLDVGYLTETQTAPFTTALYNSDNLTETTSSMAEAITYSLMQGPNSTVLYGNVTEAKTYIHVQWPWLSLTFALLFFSNVFLLVTILVTHAAHQLAWKSSLAPLLYADSNLRPAREELGRSWTMEQRAMRVNTIRSGLGKNWRRDES